MRVRVLTRAILAAIIATIISAMTIYPVETKLLVVGVAVFLITYFSQHQARRDMAHELESLE